MKSTTDEEISHVKKRLDIFEGNFNSDLYQKLTTKTPRLQQHQLFWLLLNDKTYEPIAKSLEVIKKYNSGHYYQKALNNLAKEGDPVQYKANIAETIVAAYYMNKFMKDKAAVTWERRLAPSRNSVDVTLNNYKKKINIEVTGLSEQEALSEFWKSRYHLKDALQPLVLDTKNPRYGIIISFGDLDLSHGLPVVDIKDFAKFIQECKAKGAGKYQYTMDEQGDADVTILNLNKSKKEYLEDMTIWTGWMRESLRMISKVIPKAEHQLPKAEINFVNICNLSSMSDDDYFEAMHGQLQVTVNSARPNEHKEGYADDGISKQIHDNGFSEVHGIIKSGFNYFDNDKSVKVVVANPRLELPDEVYELIA